MNKAKGKNNRGVHSFTSGLDFIWETGRRKLGEGKRMAFWVSVEKDWGNTWGKCKTN